MPSTKEPSTAPESPAKKQTKPLLQSTFPTSSLQKALQIPEAIRDNFGGRGADPNQIALAMKWTPTGGAWRALCGAAMAYGLVDSGYASKEMKMTARASAIVTPTDEDYGKKELREALMAPSLMAQFIGKYDGAKWPVREVGINVLSASGIDRARAGAAFDLVKENLEFLGALQQTKTGHMLMLNMIASPFANGAEPIDVRQALDPYEALGVQEVRTTTVPTTPEPSGASNVPAALAIPVPTNTNVFISHGKNRDLIDHLKKLVNFVKLTPVVSVEITETAKPVPQKLMEEMRSCFGGIVHVRSEGDWTDSTGKKQTKINDNVLIEIGAAQAIYRENLILLVEQDLTLPTNLQGLFVCKYEGDKTDGQATMDLLEALSKFKPH